jgi:hypothetical protein
MEGMWREGGHMEHVSGYLWALRGRENGKGERLGVSSAWKILSYGKLQKGDIFDKWFAVVKD